MDKTLQFESEQKKITKQEKKGGRMWRENMELSFLILLWVRYIIKHFI